MKMKKRTHRIFARKCSPPRELRRFSRRRTTAPQSHWTIGTCPRIPEDSREFPFLPEPNASRENEHGGLGRVALHVNGVFSHVH
jgi:hypothetical protein